MEFSEVKEKVLHSEEYEKILNRAGKENIMLLVPGGSYAKGTNTVQRDENGDIVHESDIDLRGILHNPVNEILRMECTEKPFEDRNTDTVLFYLKHVKKLMLSNNPNVFEMFGLPEDMIFYASEAGKMLIDNADIFLHKRAAESFGGYAIQQLRRAQNAIARDTMTVDDKEKHILGSINNMKYHLMNIYYKIKIHVSTDNNAANYRMLMRWERILRKTLGSKIHLYIDKSYKKDRQTEIFVDMSLWHYPLRDLKSIESDINNVLKDYDKLNHMNNKKDDIHLNKHFASLVHVLYMGIEILTEKRIRTYRPEIVGLLKDIRSGKYDYNQLFEVVDRINKEFEYAVKHTILPDEPDYDRIDNLIYDINKAFVLKEIGR